MNKNPQSKVSVIVPIYNSEKKIEKCIASIQTQTYRNIEIICVNDGSADRSREIIEKISLEDQRVIVINQKNGGVSSARNRGIQEATGKYIQFVDSDDYIDENMVELLVNSIEKNDSQLVICGYKFIHRIEERKPREGVYSQEEFYENFLYYYKSGFVNSPVNKLYIREMISKDFPNDMNIGEDAFFNMNYISQIERISVEEVAPYYYSTDDSGSLSWRYHKNAFYCEEKKNSLILKCLEECDFSTQKELKECFKEDFLRCINNEILLSGLKSADICNNVYSCIKKPLWIEIYFENIELNEELEKRVREEIKRYVEKNMVKRYLVKVKQCIKKIMICCGIKRNRRMK